MSEPGRPREQADAPEGARDGGRAPRDATTEVLEESARALEQGSVVGRYRIERRLGQGGAGTVYLACHVHTGRRVALKLLRLDVAADETTRARFLREAQLACRLSHPGVVSVLDFDLDDGRAYLVMELVEGRDLRQILESAPLEAERVEPIFCEILGILAAVHAEQVVHRDLKPENIKVLDGDRVKVLDFGIARLASPGAEQLTELGAFVGTPGYASPEQIRGGEIGPPSDLYSVGIMLFTALTGHRPFSGRGMRSCLIGHLREPAPRLADVVPGVSWSPALEDVLRRALEKAPGDRFETASSFRDALRAALQDSKASSRSREAEVERVPSCSRALIVGAVASCRLFVFGGTVLRFGRSDRDPRRGISNDVILRVLPTDDPENRAATRRISNAHGEIRINGSRVAIVDRSSRGIRLDSQRIGRGQETALADAFELDLAEHALCLSGRVLRSTEGAVEAVVLRRIGNTTGDVYALVCGSAALDDLLAGYGTGVPGEIRGLCLSCADGRLTAELPGCPARALSPGALDDRFEKARILEVRSRHFSEVEDDPHE